MTDTGKRFPSATTGVLVLSALILRCTTLIPTDAARAPASEYCKPSQPCWPSPAEWKEFAAGLVGKLVVPQSPLTPCREDASSAACVTAMKSTRNPFFLQDQPGGTQNTGWLGAWTSAPSAYAVAAERADDIVAAVKFSTRHKLRLVIKGTGHDYLGRSSAPESLLVWTHKMRRVTLQDSFVGQGCPAAKSGVPAVTLEAGTRWLEAYEEVTVKRGRYVQGGGCTSVGAAGGFLQGGGFGHWSKKYGTAAANLLEAEVVVAEGRLLIANDCQNQDLFWALGGGGGGTFGIVTRVSMRTHPLPRYFGWLNGTITAKSDRAFQELLEHFLGFYRESLSNESWGEQVRVRPDNSMELSLAYQGMTAKEAEQVWRPFRTWIDRSPERFAMKAKFDHIPADKMWNYEFIRRNYPHAIETDKRTGEPRGRYWWSGGDAAQVSTFWYTYQSRWLPLALFETGQAKGFAEALFQASRHWPFEIHFNKGQAGASAEAVQRGRETSMNPAVFDAAALLIAAAGSNRYPGIRGHEPSSAEGAAQKAQVDAAMKGLRTVTQGAGTYVNETDYFEADWQREFWGKHYARLLEIKRKYDPERRFLCHHCVGSE